MISPESTTDVAIWLRKYPGNKDTDSLICDLFFQHASSDGVHPPSPYENYYQPTLLHRPAPMFSLTQKQLLQHCSINSSDYEAGARSLIYQ